MKIEFIEDCKAIYKRWSVQFAVFAGAALATMVSERQAVVDFLNSLPPSLQPFVPFLTFLVSVGAPTLLLAIKQPTLSKQSEGEQG